MRRALVVVMLFAGCGPRPAARGAAGHGAAAAATVASNALRADYAGSKECAYCHQKIYDAWAKSPMHRMTRLADQRTGGAEVRAPFDGTTFRFKGDDVTMEANGGQRFMRLHSKREGDKLYRVTKVIGGRYREDFVGVDVTGAADPLTAPGKTADKVLPATWVFSTGTWRYKGYSVMVPERDGLTAGPVWRTQCIFCHNTVPYLSTALDDLLGPSAPAYQGKTTDRLIPRERQWIVRSRDRDGLYAALADELTLLGAPRPDAKTPLADVIALTIRATRAAFDQQHLVEVGIGCEMCHLGSKQHVDDPKLRPTFEVKSALLFTGPQHSAAAKPAERINRTCARCHTVLFSGYPWTWEGGRNRDDSAGGSTINSGEGRDFLLGGCSHDLSCTTCHDPHAEDARAKLDGIATVAGGNGICQRCHTKYVGDTAVAAHTHHAPQGAGSACVACHMPKKNMSLTYGLSRYHRIGSPTDENRVERDRPLECALCHADKTVASLVGSMETWWGKHYDRAALADLYGKDLNVGALAATLERGKAHEQAVAIVIFGEQRVKAQAAAIAKQLTHEYPLMRYFARHALETIAGKPMTIDLDGSAADIQAQAAAFLGTVLSSSVSSRIAQ